MGWINFNHKTKVWDKLTEGEDRPVTAFEISDIRIAYLDQVRKDLHNDLDHMEIIFGAVGSGKSTLGRLDIRYVSNENFNPRTHVVRDVKDVEPVFTKAKRFEGVEIDEASGILSATDTMTKKSKYATYIFDVCRQKNLMIVLCCPAIHRITSAVAVDRATTCTRVYIDSRDGKRGKFAFYGKRAKEKLYRFAKANYGSLKGVRPKYRGRFSDDRIYKGEYLKMKDETLKSALASFSNGKDAVHPETPHQIIHKYRVDLVRNNIDMPSQELADILKVSRRTITSMKLNANNLIAQEIQLLRNEKSLNRGKPETQT